MFKTFRNHILIIGLLCRLNAGDIALSGNIETGYRSTGEDYQEEDGDAEYRYQSYYFRFDQFLNPRFKYNLTGSYLDKQYETADSGDNITRSITGNGTYSFSPLLAMNLFIKLPVQQGINHKILNSN